MRRFTLPSGVKIFALLWVVLLLLPPSREIFRAQALLTGDGPALADIDALAKRYPNDPHVQTLQIEEIDRHEALTGSIPARVNRKIDRYNALLQRFPRANWLRARLLMTSMPYSIDMDFEGAPRRGVKHGLDATALHKALRCALDAEKMEPDNAFFPWMEAVLRFGLEQNEAGVAALQKAARAPSYDDFVQQGAQQKIRMFSLDHPLLFEEKLMVLISTLLPHYSQMTNAQKAALQMALDAEKRGDDGRAIQIADAILGAVQVSRRHSFTFIGILVADSMTRGTLGKINATQGFKTSKTTDMSLAQRHEYTMRLARDFATYANRHGRPDAARRALAYAQATVVPPNNLGTNWWEDFGLRPPWARVGFQGNGFVVETVFLSFGFALLWLLGRALLAILGRSDKELGEKGVPRRGQIAFSVNFSLWAMLGFAALAAYTGIGFAYGSLGWMNSLDFDTSNTVDSLLTKATPFVVIASWLLPVALVLLNGLWRRVSIGQKLSSISVPTSKRKTWTRRILWLAMLLIAGPTLSNGRGLWDDTFFQWLVSPPLAGFCFLLALGFELYDGSWLHQLPRFRLKKQRQPYRLLFAMRLAGSSAGALAVVWSFICLFSALGMWPLRATMNRAIEQRIAIGELDWMKRNAAQNPESGKVR